MESLNFVGFICWFLVTSILVSRVSSIKINCDFAFEPWPIEPLYTCKTSSLFYDDSTKLQLFEGTHLNGSLTNEDVQGLWLLNDVNELSFLPENFDLSFPHLRALKFDNTRIEKVSSEDLRQFPELMIFMSSYNPITSLPGDLFQSNSLLRQIYIFGLADPGWNIRHIGENLLANLIHLDTVRFYGHSCIENVFATTKSEIEELNINLHVLCPEESIAETTTFYETTSTMITMTTETWSEASTTESEQTRTFGDTTTSSQISYSHFTYMKLVYLFILLLYYIQ